MTEPKEEKCEACCGSGYINFWTDDGHISMRTCRRCDGYGYIKVEPMTNEEYLKSCNTEQLAEELLAWWTDGANTYSEFGLYNREIEEAKERIVKWLKEKHK